MTLVAPLDVVPLGPGNVADVALVAFVGLFASVAVVALFAYLRDRARLALATRLLQQGREVPPSLFDQRPRSERVRGVVLLAAGVGIAVFFLLGDDPSLARAGLVPGAIGGGYLLGWWLERRRVPPGQAEP